MTTATQVKTHDARLPSPPPLETERPDSASNTATSSDRIHRRNVPSSGHHSNVVKPFEEESVRVVAFSQELSAMLLDVVLEMHA
ncbi:hypothetical protein ARMGADRAFT_1075623 [Armillaria gallica]|uniref:Uncharacterized protein n=1 Tax=Armillaria gallica TaxID=47427 RepID=A0A2H3DUB9_ARMGA|nr:hypothetical protein ARMGADRAFT_1075623 [Armillaria gallica]